MGGPRAGRETAPPANPATLDFGKEEPAHRQVVPTAVCKSRRIDLPRSKIEWPSSSQADVHDEAKLPEAVESPQPDLTWRTRRRPSMNLLRRLPAGLFDSEFERCKTLGRNNHAVASGQIRNLAGLARLDHLLGNIPGLGFGVERNRQQHLGASLHRIR